MDISWVGALRASALGAIAFSPLLWQSEIMELESSSARIFEGESCGAEVPTDL